MVVEMVFTREKRVAKPFAASVWPVGTIWELELLAVTVVNKDYLVLSCHHKIVKFDVGMNVTSRVQIFETLN